MQTVSDTFHMEHQWSTNSQKQVELTLPQVYWASWADTQASP